MYQMTLLAGNLVEPPSPRLMILPSSLSRLLESWIVFLNRLSRINTKLILIGRTYARHCSKFGTLLVSSGSTGSKTPFREFRPDSENTTKERFLISPPLPLLATVEEERVMVTHFVQADARKASRNSYDDLSTSLVIVVKVT